MSTLFLIILRPPLVLLAFALVTIAALPARASLLELATARPAESPARLERALGAPLPASARGEALVENGVPQLVATLLVARDAPAQVGVLFELAAGWHLYWRNPGGTGVAPQLEFEVDGHRVGPLAWPAPETFREADGLFTTYGYEDSALLAAPLAPRAGGEADTGSAGRTRRARVSADVLVCRTECVPAHFALEAPLDTPASDADRALVRALFDETAARVPPPAQALGWSLAARWASASPAVDASGRILLTLEPCTAEGRAPHGAPGCDVGSGDPLEVEFLPLDAEVFELAERAGTSDATAMAGPVARPAATSVARSPTASTAAFTATDARGGARRIELPLDVTRIEAGEDRLRGVVVLREASGAVVRGEIDVPIAAAAPASAGFGLLQVVLLALLGGVVLNGMPCVLPVLAIKVVSVADLAERDAREVRLHGLAYGGGVLGSMLVLASIVVGLRTAGHAVGWGFQFQEPLFVAGIAALLVTFALNLFGVFEIELGQGRLASLGQDATGLSRSAFEGLLAVVLATPCTAPFLGTAVGFAFASSGAIVVAIFLAIGVGLASPFLLVSFFPALAHFVPRSGPWMLKLRAGLGFCLLATVIWLLWIVGQSGGVDAMVALTGALLLLAFLLWIFGQLQPMKSVWRARASAVAIALVAFGSFNLIELERADPAQGIGTGPIEADGFAAYSEEALREALANGSPAFVVFTADWCLTCKVNERTVLERPAVREALERAGFARFVADWTRRDDAIRAKLAEFGRAGVPLYLVYDPAAPDAPRVLSELLTQDAVLAALEAVAPRRTARLP